MPQAPPFAPAHFAHWPPGLPHHLTLPQTNLFHKLVSQTASGVLSVAALEEQQKARVGQTGMTISPLCPGGKARFGDQLLDVLTRGEMVEKGRPVKIIGHNGPNAVVEELGVG